VRFRETFVTRFRGVQSGVLGLLLHASGALAQASGSIVGRVLTAEETPVAGASVTIDGFPLTTLSDDAGRFVLGSVPPGERTLRVERI
jgi:Carboxypeptidase regulatory-like domain